MFFLFGLFGPFTLLIGVVMSVWAVLTIWRAVTLPRGGAREAVCEKCKYGVTGVAGFTCPECGSDLREVGIVTPRMEAVRRGSLAGAIVGWTFLWMVGGWVLVMVSLVFTGVSTAMSTSAASVTTWSQVLTPNSAVYQQIELDYDSDWQSLASNMQIKLTLNDGHVEALSLDPGPMTVLGLEGGEAEWSPKVVELWFAESGLDMNDPQVAAAAAETTRVIDMTIMSPDSGYMLNLSEHTNSLNPTGGAMTAVSSSPSVFDSAGFWLGLFACAVVLYALGIVMIVRRRRRLMRLLPALGAAGA